MDKPFIQHVVEYLVEQGIREFHFVLSIFPEKVEALLGNGTRWGSNFVFHLAKDPKKPYKHLKIIDYGKDTTSILISHADRLINININEIAMKPGYPLLFDFQDDREVNTEYRWSGWALVNTEILKNIPDDMDEEAFGLYLLNLLGKKDPETKVIKHLGVRSYDELVVSNNKMLSKEFTGLIHHGKESEEKIWISRNVSLHANIRLVAPVYIGENSHIGKGAVIGPNTIVGSNCVIGENSIVTESLVFPWSYVGEALELVNVIVEKNCLINAKIGAEIIVEDDFIIGSLPDSRISKLVIAVFSRLAASVLLLIFSPILLVTAIFLKATRKGPVLNYKDVVRTPASKEGIRWETFRLLSFSCGNDYAELESVAVRKTIYHFFLNFLPALVNIAKGNLRFVGIECRIREELERLPVDWRNLCLNTKVGVITETYVNYGEQATEDELYSSEAYYAAKAGILHDFGLVFRYVFKIFKLE
jgi:NDP-sugar pyrophosphorylase family protein